VNVRPHSAVVQAISNPPIGPTGDVTIVDVGVSGGLADYWRAFGGSLHASGFDPLVKSVAEANDYYKSEVESWGKMVKAIGFSN